MSTFNGWSNRETQQANDSLVEVNFMGLDELHPDLIKDLLFELAGRPSVGLANDIFNGWLSEVNTPQIIKMESSRQTFRLRLLSLGEIEYDR